VTAAGPPRDDALARLRGAIRRERGWTLRNDSARSGIFVRNPLRRSRFALILPAAAFLLIGSGAEARDAGGRILAPGTGEALVAGQVVNVAWSPFPDDVEELELLLSVDGGRFFPIRLTSQIDPRSGCFSWVVPRIAARAARLRIRFGRDGEEVEGEPGAPFSVFLSPALRPSPFVRRDGEWWIAEDRSSGPAAHGVSQSPTLGSGSRSDPAAILPPSGRRAQANAPCRLLAAVERLAVDGRGAFGPPLEAAPPGTTPRRE
jgi:hypothetical protein